MTTTYEGWVNRETWNVSLWVNNDYGMYKSMVANRPFTPTSAKQFCTDIFGKRTPDNCPLSKVDWTEIAESFNEE
jgi:hypothetical protein